MVVDASSITIYTTPTCAWCARAKEFLIKRGVAFQERDVSMDRQAAEEVIRRTGQRSRPGTAGKSGGVVSWGRS